MSNTYVWINVGPGRQRAYLKSELDRRPIRFGQAPSIKQDTIPPTMGIDGRLYDSKSSLENLAKANGHEYLARDEIADIKRSAKETIAKKDLEFREVRRAAAAEVINDFDLSNKLGKIWE